MKTLEKNALIYSVGRVSWIGNKEHKISASEG